jgi:hypothetical protein
VLTCWRQERWVHCRRDASPQAEREGRAASASRNVSKT